MCVCVFSIRISVDSFTHRQTDHSLTVSTFSFIVFVQLVIFSLFVSSPSAHLTCCLLLFLFHFIISCSWLRLRSWRWKRSKEKTRKMEWRTLAWNEVYRIHGRSPMHQFDEIKQLNKFPMMSYFFNALHSFVAVVHSCRPCIHLLLQCMHYEHKSHSK